MAKNVSKTPGQVLESGANVGHLNLEKSLASRSPKTTLSSLPEVINFYHTGKGLYIGKFVYFYTIIKDQKCDRIYPSSPLE